MHGDAGWRLSFPSARHRAAGPSAVTSVNGQLPLFIFLLTSALALVCVRDSLLCSCRLAVSPLLSRGQKVALESTSCGPSPRQGVYVWVAGSTSCAVPPSVFSGLNGIVSVKRVILRYFLCPCGVCAARHSLRGGGQNPSLPCGQRPLASHLLSPNMLVAFRGTCSPFWLIHVH